MVVGGHRRRRCALHPANHISTSIAPATRHPRGDVQQPDLRPNEGPGIADFGFGRRRSRPRRVGDYPIHPLSRGPSRPRPACRPGRDTQTSIQGVPGAGRVPSRCRTSSRCSELQHLQRRGASTFTDRDVRDDRQLVLEQRPADALRQRITTLASGSTADEPGDRRVEEAGNHRGGHLVNERRAEDPTIHTCWPDLLARVPGSDRRHQERAPPTHDELVDAQVPGRDRPAGSR